MSLSNHTKPGYFQVRFRLYSKNQYAMKYQFAILFASISVHLSAQELPYAQIPDYPLDFNAETTVARMVDGLGFRYYWATDGLRPEDLKSQPSDEARTSRETLEHIHGLSHFLLCTMRQEVQSSVDVSAMTFDELRKSTLLNIKESSEVLKSGQVTLSELFIEFEGSDNVFPFWNQINGPIADALWHVGQVVTFRRSSGNPFNSNVSVFNGKLRN